MDSQHQKDLDDEVRELLNNYKSKKSTLYEPCTIRNQKECLIGLSEEFGLLNINYVFNPLIDVENNTLEPEALVKLINSVWILLHYHKNVSDKAEKLMEQNHILEQNNKQLNAIVGRVKEKLSSERNESKACVASAQRIADRSDDILQTLTETRAKLTRLTKQKEANERGLNNEIKRLQLQNEKLLDKLRNKAGTHTSCGDVCAATLVRLRVKEKQQQAMIAQLQRNSRDLLDELLKAKEELLLGAVEHFTIDDN